MNQDWLDQKAMALFSEALDHPSSERDAWVRQACGNNQDLLDKVQSLLKADGGGDLMRTGGVADDISPPELPERVGAYRITGLIGEGGMGAVYEGRRDSDDFEHRVAVKVVRPGVLSDALVERFQRERQILASLNHPNVARLFDGGQALDGSPFIIMEFVEGVPITQWVDEQQLTLLDRLTLFSDVCAAVSHAHQNLIVHRDITPSNVLVTRDGQVKLIDFGIAKPQSDEPETASVTPDPQASMSYTPGFAAPERSQGMAATTLSDIYSLGKLLNAIVPDRQNHADLSAIIAHATAAAPEDRYPSVSALMDDIGNCKGGYPVKAVGGGAWYRIRKYIARRKLLVTSLSVGLLAIVGALGVTWVQYQRAEAALERANARFEQARELSRAVIFESYDEFAKVSGTLEARRSLVNLVSDYVDQLSDDEQAPPDILLDIGLMNNRLSDLYGGIGLANLGETEKSGELLLGAETALENLLDIDPTNSDALAELVMVKRGRSMQALIYDIDTAEAMEINEDTLAYATRGIEFADENERTFLRHFWSARTDRLQILVEMQDLETAVRDVKLWRSELDEEMFERLGGGEEMAAYLAMQEAKILIEMEQPTEAIPSLEYAQNYRLAQLENTPDSYYQMTQLMVVYMEMARSLSLSGDLEKAVRASNDAVQLSRRILAADEEDAGGPEGLNAALQNHAAYLYRTGDLPRAKSAAEEAVSLADQLLAQFPEDVYYERIQLTSQITQAEVKKEDPSSCAALPVIRANFEALAAKDVDSKTLMTDTLARLEALEAGRDC